jgi:4-hydroxy-tetrahydrodipicolinate reductase
MTAFAHSDGDSRIPVIVTGSTGKMGRETINAVGGAEDMRLVGLVSTKGAGDRSHQHVPVAPSIEPLLDAHKPKVVVDFSHASVAPGYARATMSRGIAFVSGTTGLAQGDLDEMRALATTNSVGVVVAPNFAIGAVLMVHFAKIVGRHLDWAEIIELHHEQKSDAPSGTALQTARAMREARGGDFLQTDITKQTLGDTRGGVVGGVHVHSVRLQGLMAHQEVIFGGLGQTLTLRHDTTGRACYMPGVLLAIRHAASNPGFIFGLGRLLGIED